MSQLADLQQRFKDCMGWQREAMIISNVPDIEPSKPTKLIGEHTIAGKAQDRADVIGSKGDPAELAAACDSFVAAWRNAVEAWKSANARTKVEQRSLSLGQ